MARRIILNLAILLLVFCGMAFALSNLMIKGRPLWAFINASIVLKGGHASKMTKELQEVEMPEDNYFIFGNSHAYRGYDPEIFAKAGVEVFNAGSSRQTLQCSFALMKHYRPKISKVIMDIYPGSFGIPADEAQLILMQNTPDAALAQRMLGIHLDIFTVNNMLYRLMRVNEGQLYFEDGYQGRGYAWTAKEMNEPFIIDPKHSFESRQYDQLNEIIDYCKKEKIDLTLVSQPLPRPDEPVTDYWLFKSNIRRICAERNVPFYDYTYKYDLGDSCFMDPNHLNYKGVRFFNDIFIKDKFRKKSES